MYVETYETSSKLTLFRNMRFIAMIITAQFAFYLLHYVLLPGVLLL